MSEIPEAIIDLLKKNYILAQKLVARLTEKGWYIATAESITAGYVAGFIASVAQASQCFRGGIVTYDSWSKVQLLGLPEELIRDTDGVSTEVSKLMAEAARIKFNAHIGVSTTGFAGPSGREIGLIYVGISTVKETRVNQKKFRAQREDVRLQASLEAFILALNTLDSMSNGKVIDSGVAGEGNPLTTQQLGERYARISH